VLDGDTPRAVPVRTGIADGSYTEILEGELEPGAAVIVRETAPKKEAPEKTFRFRMM